MLMAYLDQDKTRDRAVSIIAVAAVEAAAIFAVITGLTVHFTQREPPARPVIADHIPLNPPPQPDKAERKPDADRTVTRETWHPSPLPPKSGDPLPPQQPTGGSIEGGTIIERLPPPLPPVLPKDPLFTPRSAGARNAPSGWAMTSDYPTRDLRDGNQGRVGFSLSIGVDGKVESCVVTRSSGFASLDNKTCELVTRRARFNPASDETGAKVAGSYSGTIRWEIPE